MRELDIAVMCKRECFSYELYCSYVESLYNPKVQYTPINESEYNNIKVQ